MNTGFVLKLCTGLDLSDRYIEHVRPFGSCEDAYIKVNLNKSGEAGALFYAWPSISALESSVMEIKGYSAYLRLNISVQTQPKTFIPGV